MLQLDCVSLNSDLRYLCSRVLLNMAFWPFKCNGASALTSSEVTKPVVFFACFLSS